MVQQELSLFFFCYIVVIRRLGSGHQQLANDGEQSRFSTCRMAPGSLNISISGDCVIVRRRENHEWNEIEHLAGYSAFMWQIYRLSNNENNLHWKFKMESINETTVTAKSVMTTLIHVNELLLHIPKTQLSNARCFQFSWIHLNVIVTYIF